MRLLFVIGVLVMGAAAAWHFRAPLGLSQLISAIHPTDPTRAAAAAGARKCLSNGKVTYTNEACPAGSREQALSGGTLTVLKAAPVVPPAVPSAVPSADPSTNASAPAQVRSSLLDPKAPNVREQRMEAVIGR